MSKRSLFWGQASGKLGEAVFYRAGGEQRTRAWVAKIKNPRSRAQAKTRATMANLTIFYRTMQSVLKDSFTSRKANQSGFNAFVQKSKNDETGVIGEGGRRLGMCFPYGFHIADGTAVFAPSPAVVEAREGETVNVRGLSLLSYVSSEYQDPQFSSGNDIGTLKSFLADYLNSRGGWFAGFPRKFALFIVMCPFLGEGYRPYWRKYEIDGSDIDLFDDKGLIEDRLMIEADETPMAVGYSNFGLITSNDGVSHFCAAVTSDANQLADGLIFGGAFVAFRDGNGKLTCSDAQLVFANPSSNAELSGLAPYLPGGSAYESVVQALTGSQTSLV